MIESHLTATAFKISNMISEIAITVVFSTYGRNLENLNSEGMKKLEKSFFLYRRRLYIQPPLVHIPPLFAIQIASIKIFKAQAPSMHDLINNMQDNEHVHCIQSHITSAFYRSALPTLQCCELKGASPYHPFTYKVLNYALMPIGSCHMKSCKQK